MIGHDASEAGRAKAVDLPSFDAEELDQRMLDQLLDQQNSELNQTEKREASQSPEGRQRTDRRAAR